jgi:hypothetical protein
MQDKYGRSACLLGVEQGATPDVLEALYQASSAEPNRRCINVYMKVTLKMLENW